MTWKDPRLDAFRGRLDRVSADIKALEDYLTGVVAFVAADVPLGLGAETISWALCEPDRWRIVHRGGPGGDRPLMEAKVHVRLAAVRVLPLLLQRIGDIVGAIEDNEAIVDAAKDPR